MAREARIEVFQGNDKKWYFRRIAANNKKTASSQGYRWKWSAKRAAAKNFPDTTLKVIE